MIRAARVTKATRTQFTRRRVLQVGAGTGLSFVAPRLIGTDILGAAPSRQSSPTSFALATNRMPSDLDPHSAADSGSGLVLQGLFEGLIRLKAGTTDEYVPVLAESWAPNADQSVWTFRLRDGVRFHDGTPLDAEAARASFARLLRLQRAPSQVLGRFVTDPARISAPDSRTLVFDLGRPQPLFEAAMASAYGTAIVNVPALRRHEVDGDWGHAWAQTNSDGIGTGQYRVVDFDIASGVVLERFNDSWRGRDGGHFDQILIRVVTEPETRLALLERGDVDVAKTLPFAVVRDLEQDPDLVVDHRYNLAVRYIMMTVAGPLEPPEARQALCWAFPYDDVIAGAYEGFAKRARGPVAALCRGFDPSTFLYQTHLERADALLRTGGVDEGTVLTMPLPPGNTELTTTMQLFQANLAAIGITLDMQLVDFATYVGIFYSDLPPEERPHLFPGFNQPDYNDAWNHLWPQLSCAAWQAGNAGCYCDPQVEELLKQARTAVDATSYQAALSAIQQIVTRENPAAIYYAETQWLTALRRDIGGFAPDLVDSELVDFSALYRRPA